MSVQTVGIGRIAAAARRERVSVRGLLACGVAAGPVFGVVATAQVLTRDGFDLSRQPLSLLSLGDLGWIQIGNFAATGLLALAGAIGMRRVLRGGRAGRWGAGLVAVFGLAMVAAGIFCADPSMGYPVGAPEGPAESYSWHSILHGVAAQSAFFALIVATSVFARRFAGQGLRGWAIGSALAGPAVIAVMALPVFGAFSVRLALGSAVAFVWLSAVSARLISEQRASS